MRFSDFVEAVRESWGVAENATVLMALLAGAGLSATFGTVPTLPAMVTCLAFYIAGFLCACYRNVVDAKAIRKMLDEKDSQIASLRDDLSRERDKVEHLKISLAVVGFSGDRIDRAANGETLTRDDVVRIIHEEIQPIPIEDIDAIVQNAFRRDVSRSADASRGDVR